VRNRGSMAILMTGLLFAVSGCAASTRADLQAEQEHGAHFASWQHMGYSLFRDTPQKTTRQDIAAAEREKWWGDVIRVSPIM